MSNKQLNQEYKNMMGAASKVAFIAVVRSNHDVSLLEAAKMAESEGLGHLTVGEVFFDKAVGFGAAKALPATRKSNAVDADEVSTRTPTEREDYDRSLLDALTGKKWISAASLRAAAGGTPLQARKALNRLIDSGKVKFKGKARATKYKLVRKSEKKKGSKEKAA